MTFPSPAPELETPGSAIRQAVAQVCQRDPDFLLIEQEAGLLLVRRWPATFASLVRIILGQQLSTKAAQAIFLRLQALIELTPAPMLACPDLSLQEVGLSRAKILTCKGLADAVLAGTITLEALATEPDAAIINQLTQIKGIGPWTAELYLLFCLERLSSFPASDLALQGAYQRLKQLPHRPSRQELITQCQTFAPWQGAAAHLLWHYYRYHQLRQEAKCSSQS